MWNATTLPSCAYTPALKGHLPGGPAMPLIVTAMTIGITGLPGADHACRSLSVSKVVSGGALVWADSGAVVDV
jgi:hypothetical protein